MRDRSTNVVPKEPPIERKRSGERLDLGQPSAREPSADQIGRGARRRLDCDFLHGLGEGMPLRRVAAQAQSIRNGRVRHRHPRAEQLMVPSGWTICTSILCRHLGRQWPLSGSLHQLRLRFRRPELDDLAQITSPSGPSAPSRRAQARATGVPAIRMKPLGVGLIVAARLFETGDRGIVERIFRFASSNLVAAPLYSFTRVTPFTSRCVVSSISVCNASRWGGNQ